MMAILGLRKFGLRMSFEVKAGFAEEVMMMMMMMMEAQQDRVPSVGRRKAFIGMYEDVRVRIQSDFFNTTTTTESWSSPQITDRFDSGSLATSPIRSEVDAPLSNENPVAVAQRARGMMLVKVASRYR